MKMSVAPRAMTDALSLMGGLCNGAATLPVLGCVLLRAEGQELWVRGTNLEQDLEVRVSLSVSVDEPGACVVSWKRLIEALKRCACGRVSLTSVKDWLLLCGEEENGEMRRLELLTMPVEEFPKEPVVTGDAAVRRVLPAGFGQMLRAAVTHVCVDEGRAVLCGVLLEASEKEVRCVATDGRRLIQVVRESEGGPLENVVIPTAAVRGLIEVLGESEVSVTVGDVVRVDGGEWRYVTRRIEGSFPNYRQVIPKRGAVQWTVERVGLAKALTFMGVLAVSGADLGVRLTVQPGKLEMRANLPDVGQAKAVVPIEGTGSVVTSVNPKFLGAVLSVMEECDRLQFDQADESSPLRVVNEGTTCVVMPMRVA